jgi:ABC-2 type transport system permease protein
MLSNFLRFPMVFLSGTFVYLETLPSQLQIVARFLPLTYSVEALRLSIGESAVTSTYLIDIAVLVAFTLASARDCHHHKRSQQGPRKKKEEV